MGASGLTKWVSAGLGDGAIGNGRGPSWSVKMGEVGLIGEDVIE